ncbi:MAG TPA: hypothetical protein VJO33_17650 [Gemmatimonadaceae bacterium]|nr:hypothetical protein [Gemmatimonadaceae bacterium]
MLCVLLVPRLAHAQDTSLVQRLGLDRLQFVSLGASFGRVAPSQVVPAQIYAFSTDYGELARNWHAVFDVSFWASRYTDAAVGAFMDSVRKNVADPTNDDSFPTSRVQAYDITFSASIRWQSAAPVAVRPFAGFGIAAHVINAEGSLIKGTFVERALDNVSTGAFVNAGILFRPWGRLVVETQGRADVLSGFRSLQVRAGALYLFGPPRREEH